MRCKKDCIIITASMGARICSHIFLHKEELAREGLLLFFHVPCLDIGKTVQDSAFTVVISNGEQFCNHVVNVF